MLSKKQVKALLEVISDDEARPVLTTALLDEHDGRAVLIATDSYKMAIIDLEMEGDFPEFVPVKGNLIARQSLVTWYKLAAAKDYINNEQLIDMSEKPAEHMKWPEWKQILKVEDGAGLYRMSFNAQYAATLQTLAGQPLQYDVVSDHSPMIAKDHANTYVLMPCRVY